MYAGSTQQRLIHGVGAGVVAAILAATASCPAVADSAGSAPRPPAVDFRRDVYPLLSARCFRCHRGSQARSGYRLDLREEILGETNGVPLVVVGDSAASRLVQVVSGTDADVVMPPEGPRLSRTEIETLRRWIDGGLEWDAELLPPLRPESKHWAFQVVRRPAVPHLPDDVWSWNPIDRFIAFAHRQHGVRPAEDADRRTWLRRVWQTLCGLPPTFDHLQAFQQDERADACERQVEALLTSPAYGERWGRHWLDVARWAESEGFESNHPRPFAWRYRDYVVGSFNSDRPYDEFLLQQIAGDELPDYADEHLIATGFLAAARISSNEEDKWLQRNDVNVDIVNALGSALLGLTLHCAQCHNHKFDPITLRDYYSLQAFFVRGQPVDVRLLEPRHCAEYEAARPPEYEPALALKQALYESARRRMIAAEMHKLTPEEVAAVQTPPAQRTPAQELLARKADLNFQKTAGGIEKHLPPEDRALYEQLKRRIAQIEQTIPPIPQTFAYYSPVTSPHRLEVLPSQGFYPLPFDPPAFEQMRPYVMPRGDVHQIGPRVSPDWPTVLQTPSLAPESSSRASRTRTDLARWLTDPHNPLVARVWVNRIWHYHFGRGLVPTVDDFGLRGQPPSHPELLDWLAAELIASGWSTRHIQRLIVTSRTYRQSGKPHPEALQRDPDNRLWTRWTPRRLEAEALRDSLLAVAGRLDRTLGGRSVPPDLGDRSSRRSLYLFQRRGRPPELQGLFDGPNECAASQGQRTTSTTPLQSLYLLNEPFWLEQAQHLAEALQASCGGDDAAFIRAAFRAVLQRDPRAGEQEAARKLLDSPRPPEDEASTPARPASPRTLLCHALLNLNELAWLE